MDFPNLRAEVLTGIVTGIEMQPDYLLSGLFGGLTVNVDGDFAKWDEITPNREQDKTFEGRHSEATNTDPSGVSQRGQGMFVSFKKRSVFPEDFDALRAVGGASADVDRAMSNLALALGDMRRRYYDEPREYLIAAALQDNLSVTVKGKTVAPDFGLPATHDLVEVASWATGSTDIDAKVETVKRLMTTDAGRRPVMALCGRNVFGYLRKNTAIKSWLQNQTGAKQDFEALLQDRIDNLLGMTWITHRGGYFVGGTFTPYIPDDTVIFVPVPDRSWFQMHQGSVRYPTAVYGDPTNFSKVYGLASWSRLNDNPPSATVYMRHAGIAVPVFPACIVVLDTTP